MSGLYDYIEDIVNIATLSLLLKFPEVLIDFNKNKFDVFQSIETIMEELWDRNGELFVHSYTDNLVDVKEVACEHKNTVCVYYK